MTSNQECRRNWIYEFYFANQSRGTKFTYDHFKAEYIPRKTIYRTIKRAENDSPSKSHREWSYSEKKMTFFNIARLKKVFNNHEIIGLALFFWEGYSIALLRTERSCSHSKYIFGRLYQETSNVIYTTAS